MNDREIFSLVQAIRIYRNNYSKLAERMPTINELAEMMGISPETIKSLENEIEEQDIFYLNSIENNETNHHE